MIDLTDQCGSVPFACVKPGINSFERSVDDGHLTLWFIGNSDPLEARRVTNKHFERSELRDILMREGQMSSWVGNEQEPPSVTVTGGKMRVWDITRDMPSTFSDEKTGVLIPVPCTVQGFTQRVVPSDHGTLGYFLLRLDK